MSLRTNAEGLLECNYGPYVIDELGRVKGQKGQWLKPYTALSRSYKYYSKIDLRPSKSVVEKWLLHRVTLYSFMCEIFGHIPKEIFDQWQVDHGDRNTMNCELYNLLAVSQSENQRLWRGLPLLKNEWTEEETYNINTDNGKYPGLA